jgi:hypothetical protein
MELKEYPQSWYYACWSIYLCYCYAAFFPAGAVWGIHFIAYIPSALKILLLIVGSLLLVPKIQRSFFLRIADLLGFPKGEQKARIIPAAIVAGICFLIFRTFNIATDIYGDNIHMLKEYGDNGTFDWKWIGDIFSPHWVDNKEALTVGVHRIIAYVFSISIGSAYQIMSELCGAIFIFIWLLFLQRIAKGNDVSSKILRVVLILLGMFAGAELVFFGHVENYSFGILTFTFFLVALYFYLEEKIGTLVFVLLYVLALKAHIIGILFLPAFLVALAYRYRNKLPNLQLLFSWRVMLNVVILPAFIIGVVLYIFLFHSWNEPYAYALGRQFQQSFLPIITLPVPLDHYSLWSLYHIADLFNLFLLVSAPILVTLVGVIIFNRKEINWSQPRIMIFGLAALFPFLFFMAMNPMLSPVRDWDVYTLLFPSLLFFAAMLLGQSKIRPYAPAWLAQTIVFGVIFTTVLVAVNASPDELQPRLQDAGAYTYRSYYAGSDYVEAGALAVVDTSDEAYAHFANIVHSMARSSTTATGADPELAIMMSRLASLYTFLGNSDSAVVWATAACNTDTGIHRYVLDLAGYYVQIGKLDEGSRILKQFLKYRAERNDTDNSYIDQIAATMSQLGARYSRTGKDSLTVAWAEAAMKTQPLKLKYTYDIADYYAHTGRAKQALDLLHTIPPDSVSIERLTTTAIAEAYAFGPDSGLPYLYKARAMAPNDQHVDSLITAMKGADR